MKKLKHTREQLQRWVINNRTVFRNGLDNGHSQSEITAFIKTFGLGKSKQTWVPYTAACKIVRKAGIKTFEQFYSWNRPPGIPSHPDTTYKQAGWSSWKEFLGTGKPNCMKAMSYSQACKIVRKARIKNQKQFQSWNRPPGIPSHPDRAYKQSGWSTWGNFLGTGRVQNGR